MSKWIHEYNDYSGIYVSANSLYHACDINGLSGILGNQYFWATELMKLEDTNEGKIGLEKLRSYDFHMSEQQKKLLSNKLSKENIENILKQAPSYVLCTSQSLNAKFLFKDFHSGSIKKGADYIIEIEIDENEKPFYIYTMNGEKRTDCIKMGKVIYDENLQKQLFEEKINGLWDAMKNDTDLLDEYKIEYLIKKTFFLSTFFKKEIKNKVSKEEDEIRLIIHTHSSDNNIKMKLPLGNSKHIYVFYDPFVIKRIWTKDDETKNVLMNNSKICNFVRRNCADVQVCENW